MNTPYIFKSERLGFRNWIDSDFDKMHAVSSDPKVMEYFSSTRTEEQTRQFIEKMHQRYTNKGYCYFPVELLDSGDFIGFIGLSEQHFKSDFTPMIDIGWRLGQKHWNKGYATEGAKRCLQYAFETLELPGVNATAAEINLPSIRVMEKIGMEKVKTFIHPSLANNERLKQCVLYQIKNNSSLEGL